MFYQLFVIIVPLITIPYISRVLGPSGVGINSYTNSIAQYFILLGSLGVSTYGNRQIAYERQNKNKMSQTFWGILFLRLLTIIGSILIYFACMNAWGNYDKYFIAQSIQVVAAAFDISWFFMGVENFRVTVVRNVFVKILTLILIFVFVRNHSDTLIYIILIGMSGLIGNITLFPYLKNYVVQPKWKQLKIWRNLKPSLILFIPQVAIQIYVVFNKTMLGKFVSVESAGYYDNADKIIRIMLAIATAAGTVLLPHVANLFVNKEFEKIKESLYTSFDFVTFITVPMAFGLAALAKKFAILFFGRDFKIVGDLLMIECVAAIFITWSYAIGTQYLIPTSQNKNYTIAVVVGAIINIILNIPLIIFWGAYGAMWVTVFSEMSVALSMLFIIRKQVKLKKLFTSLWKYLIAAGGMYTVVRFIDQATSTSWLYIIIEIFIGALIYIGLIFILHPNLIDKVKHLIW